MSGDGSSITEFDWLTEGILKELRSMNGEGDSSELKERLGVDRADKISYRFENKLEPPGYIETEQREGGTGPNPAKIGRLTSRGEGLADQLLDAGDSDELSISAEVDQLHAEVNKLESTIEEQQESINEQEEAIEELQGRYNQMYEAYQELSGTSD
jgi:DNA-binding PadR family transcriptional regulator